MNKNLPKNSTWRPAPLLLVMAVLAAGCGGPGVQSDEAARATLLRMQVSPSRPTLAVDTAQKFTAIGYYSDGTTADLTQRVQWTAVAADGRPAPVDNDGYVTGTAVGTMRVSASWASYLSEVPADVTAATLKALTLSPGSPKIAKGSTLQFIASAVFSDGTTQDVSRLAAWSVVDLVGSGVTSVDTSGLATGKAEGKATVSAKYKTKSASTVLDVTAAALTSLTLAPLAPAVAKGGAVQFALSGNFSDGTTQTLTTAAMWTATDLTGTGVAAIDTAGRATGTAVGDATITGAYGGLATSTILHVNPAVLTGLRIDPSTATLPKGGSQAFRALGIYSDGTTVDLSASSTWSVADVVGSGVVSVDAKGVITAKSVGKATLSAVFLTTRASASIEVVASVLTALAVSPASATVGKGKSVQLHATGVFSDGTTQDVSTLVTWSADTAGALAFSISSAGLVTGTAAGSGLAQAQYKGLTATAKISVTTGWVAVTVPATGYLKGIWGTSDSDVWAVGEAGTILHWNGTSWSSIPSGTTQSLYGIRGLGPNDVWVTGYYGVVLHWNGKNWSTVPTPADNALSWNYDVWPNAANDVWIVGTGAPLHWDGTSFTSVSSFASTQYAAWGASPGTGEFWSAGTSLTRWLGATPTTTSPFSGQTIWGLGGMSKSDLWAVSYNHGIFHYDGTTWSAVASPAVDALAAVWSRSRDDAWAVGWSNTILHWDGTAWTPAAIPVAQNIIGIWGSGNSVWAVGWHGTLLQYQY